MLRDNEKNKRPNRKKTFASLPAIAAFGCLLIFLPLAKTTAQTALPPGVNVRLEATPKKATVGDLVRIDLDVTTPPGYRAEILKPEAQIGDFSILSFSSEPTATEPNGSLLHHGARITGAIYKPGSFTLPPFRILLEDGSGNKTILSSPSVNIKIQSVIDKDIHLRDLKKQAAIREKFRWLFWLALALAGCILALIGWRLWKRKSNRSPSSNNPTPTRDPLDVSESELRALLDRGLPAEGHEKKFYILLSDVVKRILESGFGVSVAEQTTSEIMESMRQAPGLSAEKLEHIETFLVRCDIVKFAKFKPSTPDHKAAGENALIILAAARANRQSAAVN